MMTSAKKSVARLVEVCYRRGLREVIFSPGSRNAPLVIAFTAHKGFNCQTVPDERVAAFIALGHGIATSKPTIICCTSGSAVLNYAPAIVEAYYQHVPLLVLTADRPSEWIDQGIGQSMRQKDVYYNYIKSSSQWIEQADSDDELLANDQIFNQAISAALTPPLGPAHINLPFYEPLYDTEEIHEFNPPLKLSPLASNGAYVLDQHISDLWKEGRKKVIIAGLFHPNTELSNTLSLLAEREDIVLITETTANIKESTIGCIDRALNGVGDSSDTLRPDLLISIGGPIVSKLIKAFFRKNKPNNHIYIDSGKLKDTYRTDPVHIDTEPLEVLKQLMQISSSNNEDFQNEWQLLEAATYNSHKNYIEKCVYSDLKVMSEIFTALPRNSNVHLANSTPVRYAQLFNQDKDVSYYSNRGVSGIDGSISTSIGFAQRSNDKNILITGDMSFFYDSNAFWIKRLPSNLAIILINNGGGGIFRYIPGPDTTNQLEAVFEAHHNFDASHICRMYGMTYYQAKNLEEFKEKYALIVENRDRMMLLEVFTPQLENAQILREYFEYIKTNTVK